MNAPVERTASVLKSWFIFGLCMLAASLLTPHGINALIYPLAVMKMTSLVHIAEWESANFSKLGPLEMCLLAFLYVVMAYGVKLRPMRALLLIVLLHLTLQHIRQETLLAIVGTLVVTGPLAAVFAPGFSAPVSAKNRTAWGFGTALLAMIALARLAIPDPLVESVTKPLHAMASVSGEMRQRPMLNDYGMGGYLIFLGLRPFIDGRNDMYGDDFTNDFAALGNSDETKLTATLARFDIAWAIFRPGDAMNQRLEHLGWKMTYQDGFAVVHER